MTNQSDDGSGTDGDTQTYEPSSQSSPTTYKVLGELSDTDATGVLGRNTNASGATYGVWGVTQSDGNGATGIRGEATNSSGQTYGVAGKTDSAASEAAGVRGSAIGDNHGVDGRVYDTESNLPTLASSESAGMFGRTDKPRGFGVVGWSTNHLGVLGRSDDGDSAGVWAFNSASGPALYSNGLAIVDGNQEVRGDSTVEGAQTVGNLGASVWLSSNTTIPDNTSTTVPFDRKDADDRNEFDTSTHTFTAAHDGDYLVNAKLGWGQWFDQGDYHSLYVYHNGNITTSDQNNSPGDTITPTLNVSKVLRNVQTGDTIHVEVKQKSGGDMSLGGGASTTHLDISQIG